MLRFQDLHLSLPPMEFCQKNSLKRNYTLFFVIVSLGFTITGCSEYQEVLKSSDYALKLQKAKQYYDAGQYYKALPLFDELVTFYKGSKEMEDISYYYAYTHYNLSEYLLAAYYFKSFSSTYVSDARAEECLYMNAKCYYQMAPDLELEQSYSEKAMDELQLFINQYPSSKYVADANLMIDNLRRKLELKAFRSAELYFKMGKYKAAAVAFSNMMRQYPDSPDSERALFMIVKSNFLFALNSVTEKQKERYQNTIDSYQSFTQRYGASPYLQEAINLYESSIKNLNKIKTDEQE
jgi:outer membrane protein assembly factor BamD